MEQALSRTEWVTPENTEMDSYTTFEYNSKGQLTKSTMHLLKDSTSTYSTYTYNNDKIEKRTSYYNDQPAMFDEYVYDQNGNLTKEERYFFNTEGKPELATSTEYQFDNKNNSYISFKALMVPGEHTNRNNISKKIHTIYSSSDGSVEDVQTTEYSYQYNAKGFPEQRNDGFEFTYY